MNRRGSLMTATQEKRARNRKPYTIHGTDVQLNRDALKEILDKRGMEYKTFFYKLKDEYELDMEYKGFMSLLQNRSAWKLIYAWGMADVLKVDIKDIFEKISVDVEAKKLEKEQWNKQYGKKR